MSIFIGCDPGSTSGAITIMKSSADSEIRSIEILAMPRTEKEIMLVFRQYEPGIIVPKAIIEAQHAFPGMSAKGQWTFAQHYGFIRGCLVTLGIPFYEISPQKWMSYFGFKRKKGEDKKVHKTRILQKAQNLYPHSSATLQTADSLMICEFLRLNEGGL